MEDNSEGELDGESDIDFEQMSEDDLRDVEMKRDDVDSENLAMDVD